jgi:hypothetical protein
MPSSQEVLRDTLVLIFDEMTMRHTGSRDKQTGFETISDTELHIAFYRTLNEMVSNMF